jgi:hypothetical protein
MCLNSSYHLATWLKHTPPVAPVGGGHRSCPYYHAAARAGGQGGTGGLRVAGAACPWFLAPHCSVSSADLDCSWRSGDEVEVSQLGNCRWRHGWRIDLCASAKWSHGILCIWSEQWVPWALRPMVHSGKDNIIRHAPSKQARVSSEKEISYCGRAGEVQVLPRDGLLKYFLFIW